MRGAVSFRWAVPSVIISSSLGVGEEGLESPLEAPFRFEDLTDWVMEAVKETRRGSWICTYSMASQLEGDKTGNTRKAPVRRM
jgi:hypothetical protein